jgi:hypothetical protein
MTLELKKSDCCTIEYARQSRTHVYRPLVVLEIGEEASRFLMLPIAVKHSGTNRDFLRLRIDEKSQQEHNQSKQ